jgi:hypothetical protein
MMAGLGKRAVGKKFGVSEDSVFRHCHSHMSEAAKAAKKAEILRPGAELKNLVINESRGLLESLQVIRAGLFRQFDLAIEIDDRSGAASMARELHRNLELMAKATGELLASPQASVTNIVLTPDYIELRGQLLGVLRRFPEAARAVAEVFRGSEAQAATAIRALSASEGIAA